MTQPPNSQPDFQQAYPGAGQQPPLPQPGWQNGPPQGWEQQGQPQGQPHGWEQQAPQQQNWQGGQAGQFTAPYQQAQFGQYGYAVTAPLAPKRKTLGLVAFLFATIGTAASSVIGAIFGPAVLIRLSEYEAANGAVDYAKWGEIDLSFFAPVRDNFLWLEISLWVGSIMGITAIVLGIIAIAQNRGRGLGIAAVVVGVLGFIVWALSLASSAVSQGLV